MCCMSPTGARAKYDELRRLKKELELVKTERDIQIDSRRYPLASPETKFALMYEYRQVSMFSVMARVLIVTRLGYHKLAPR